MKVYAIWCKDINKNRGGWLKEIPSNVDDGGIALLAFTSEREAKRRAAKHYGFDNYADVKKDGWCEVRVL